MKDEKTSSPLSETLQHYVLDRFGCGDEALGRDLLLALARRVAFAREVHPVFRGMKSVADEFAELSREASRFCEDGDSRRMREEALDVMATCIRLYNVEVLHAPEDVCAPEPYVSGAAAGTVAG
jgi:hypothetical protein